MGTEREKEKEKYSYAYQKEFVGKQRRRIMTHPALARLEIISIIEPFAVYHLGTADKIFNNSN